jgi:hypothetical protein
VSRIQIVNLVLLIVMIAAGAALWQGRQKHHRRLLNETQRIGNDLITTTNSSALDRVGWGLRVKLHEFLDPKTRVAAVLLDDEPEPIGNGTASIRLFLTNGRGENLGIRLREDFERFHVVGFWIFKGQIRTNQ